MTFQKTVFHDALATFQNMKWLILWLVFFLPVVVDLLPLLVDTSSASRAVHVCWLIVMFYGFQFVLRGKDYDEQGQHGLLGFFMINAFMLLSSMLFFLLFYFTGSLAFLSEMRQQSLAFVLSSSVFVVAVLIFSNVLFGTWLPAKVVDWHSGLGYALKRAPSQSWYVASRLVGCVAPIVLLGILLVSAATSAGIDFRILSEGWQFSPLALFLNATIYFLIAFAHIVCVVVLSRAFVRADFDPSFTGSSVSMPYIGVPDEIAFTMS